MATKSKKTTRATSSRKKSAQPTGGTSATTVAKAAVKSAETSAVEAAVKKVAAAPSTQPSPTSAGKGSEGKGNVTELAKVSSGAGQAHSVTKKEFVSRVAKRAGLRPNQVRAATEAALEELGRALVAGEELKLPGIGKIQVKRKRDIGDAEVMVCKVRRKKDENSDASPLASAAEGR